MINGGHDLCLCIILGNFPKSKVCRLLNEGENKSSKISGGLVE
jgi:hypothetical protein